MNCLGQKNWLSIIELILFLDAFIWLKLKKHCIGHMYRFVFFITSEKLSAPLYHRLVSLSVSADLTLKRQILYKWTDNLKRIKEVPDGFSNG